jgi:hypothetical protein
MVFNTRINQTIAELLDIHYPEKTTLLYEKNLNQQKDARSWANAKEDIPVTTPKYTQVFSEKNGFISNMSILDLLFNEGPGSVALLRSV